MSILSGDTLNALSGVRKAARWVAEFHGSHAPLGDPDHLWDLYNLLADRLSAALARRPEELEQLRPMVAQLERAASQVGKGPPAHVHGEFLPAKVYLDENAVTVVDVNGTLAGDPSRDLAEFVWALRSTTPRAGSAASSDALAQAFLDEYARERPQGLHALPFYLGARILISMCEEGGSLRETPADGSVFDGYRKQYEQAVSGDLPGQRSIRDSPRENELMARASEVVGSDFIQRFVSPTADCTGSIVRDIGSGRITLRYEVGGKAQIFGKLYSDDIKGRFGFDVLRLLWNGGFGGGKHFQVSEPLSYLPEYRLLLIRSVEGIPLEDGLFSGAQKLVSDARRAAQWLALLHASSIRIGDPDPPWFAMRLFPVLRRLMKAAVFAPDERSTLMRTIDAFCRRAKKSYRRVPWVQTHGRYHHEHVFLGPDQVSVIDFDTSVPSDPSKDLSEFVSCFRSLAFKQTGSVSLAEEPTKAFLDEYVSLLPGFADNLALHWAANVMASMFKRLRKQRAKHKYEPESFERLMDFFRTELHQVLEGDLLSPYVSKKIG